MKMTVPVKYEIIDHGEIQKILKEFKNAKERMPEGARIIIDNATITYVSSSGQITLFLGTTVEVRTKNRVLYNNAHGEFVLKSTKEVQTEVQTAPKLATEDGIYDVNEFVELVRKTFKVLLLAVASYY